MAKRLSTKHRKQKRDILKTTKNGTLKKKHKVAVERAKKARFKNNTRAI